MISCACRGLREPILFIDHLGVGCNEKRQNIKNNLTLTFHSYLCYNYKNQKGEKL